MPAALLKSSPARMLRLRRRNSSQKLRQAQSLTGGRSFPLSPQDAVLEDVSIPVSELGSPGGADGALGQLVPADGLLGGGPRAFGEPVTVAMPAAPASPAPPIPAPTRRRSGGGSPSLCAFLALGGGEESQALHAPLLELDAVTTQCPHCGRVTKYPIGTVAEPGAALPGAAPVEVPVEAGEAPEGQALIDLLLDPVPVGGQSIPPCTGWAAPPVGFRATGGTMLGSMPAPPLPVSGPLGTVSDVACAVAAGPGPSGPAPNPTPSAGSVPLTLPAPAPPAVSRASGSAARQGRGSTSHAHPSASFPSCTGGGARSTLLHSTSGSYAPSGPMDGPAPLFSLPTNTGAAAGAGPAMFTFGAGRDMPTRRPVPPWSKRSRDGSALAGLWTLPLCQVTVCLRPCKVLGGRESQSQRDERLTRHSAPWKAEVNLPALLVQQGL